MVKRLLIAILIPLILCLTAEALLACTGYLTGEQVVRTERNGYVRTLRLCYYDHLGEPMVISISAERFCPATINVPHHNEDRDGDGRNDDEEEGQ